MSLSASKNIDDFTLSKTAWAIVGRSVAQAIPTATETKIQFDTAYANQNTVFDLVTNFRYVPNVAGIVLGEFGIIIDAITAAKTVILTIKKNGTPSYVFTRIVANTGNFQLIFPFRATCNGSTDYFEFFIQHDHGSNRNIGSDFMTYVAANALPLVTS